jgi:hypothetical protein
MTQPEDAATLLRWIVNNTPHSLAQISKLLDGRVTERTLRRWLNRQTEPKTSDLNALRLLHTSLANEKNG